MSGSNVLALITAMGVFTVQANSNLECFSYDSRGYLQYSKYAEDFVEAASGGVEFRQADSTTRVFSETCSSAQPVLNTLMEKLGGSGSVPEVECGDGSKTVS